MRPPCTAVLLAAVVSWAQFQSTQALSSSLLSPSFSARKVIHRRSQHVLHMSRNNNNGWSAPNDFRTFLTQCSIQSFMFLLSQMRDPQTCLWLEGFTQPAIKPRFNEKKEDKTLVDVSVQEETKPKPTTTLLRYHGLAAINTTLFPTWEDYFFELLQQPSVTLSVESTSAHIPNYELDIEPAKLCSRIISVREQIAREFSHDLGIIANMGGHTLESYWENLKALRKKDEDNKSEGAAGIQRPNLLFLEINPDQHTHRPSPLRKGNFDLLVLLATQESIHRVLNNDSRKAGASERVSNEFLHDFYKERIVSHFTGSQRYGRADDFLEELLLCSPRIKTLEDDVASLVDPTRIAEIILKEREKVAMEWKEVATESPNEHMEIRKLQLNQMMGVLCNAEDEEEECTDWQ